MIAAAPQITQEEVRQILRELEAEGISIPEPKSVTVEAGEDHEGDPVYYMTVTFAKKHKVEDIRWMRISPLVMALSNKVFLSGGGNHAVIPTIRRLADKVTGA
jgi:hypothetical protein